MLKPMAASHPSADLRVVLLTDGQNNSQAVTALDAFRAAHTAGVTVDAILVGSSAHHDLTLTLTLTLTS
jgi:hypothetical protein